MASVIFRYQGEEVSLAVRAVQGRERVGEASRFDLELIGAEPVALDDLLGRLCMLRFDNGFGGRVVHGIVARAVAIATSQAAASRLYRVTVRSTIHRLQLRRTSRVWQHMTAPDIVASVLEGAGLGGEASRRELAEAYEPLDYVVQYAETDAGFVRRICEEHGLWFRLAADEGFDALVLCDRSQDAPSSLDEALLLADDARLGADRRRAFGARVERRRRPGKLTVRDRDPERPALCIEGAASGGGAAEAKVQVYRAPAGARTPAAATRRAQLALEVARAEAETIELRVDALELAPGTMVSIESHEDLRGSTRVEGDLFVVQVDHDWRSGDEYIPLVTGVRRKVPYRLERKTPPPRIWGVHSAVVTGAAGEEVHTDAAARVRVRFPWDRTGPLDDRSSVPVRVAQCNIPGSMLVPRVGWEVWVVFEDGDPDRPLVIGRAFNGKQPPPVALPVNKTMTRLGTSSSPGGGKQNSVTYEDAAGKQGMSWMAGFGRDLYVANHMLTQVGADETYHVGAAQMVTVGGFQAISCKVYGVSAKSQNASVSGTQTVTTAGAMDVKVGSEVVMTGLLTEQVGSPSDGLLDLAGSVFFTGFGYFTDGPVAQLFGVMAGALWDQLKTERREGREAGELAGKKSALLGLLGVVIPGIEGLDAVISGAEAAEIAPWQPDKSKNGDRAWQPEKEVEAKRTRESSSAAGANAAAPPPAGAAGAGSRTTEVGGLTMELVGASYGIATPGPVKWTTLGASNVIVGGNHSTAAGKVSFATLGQSSLKAGSFHVIAKDGVARDLKSQTTTIAGPLSVQAGGPVVFSSGAAMALRGDAVTMKGGTVEFECGGSKVAISGAGLVVTTKTVKFSSLAKLGTASVE